MGCTGYRTDQCRGRRVAGVVRHALRCVSLSINVCTKNAIATSSAYSRILDRHIGTEVEQQLGDGVLALERRPHQRSQRLVLVVGML